MKETISVLIVEDEPIVAMDTDSTLESLGYTVVGIVNNGSDAIRLAEERNPDVILMDIIIKGKIDGIETADRIHKERNIPIIFVTAYSDEETVCRANETTPYGYLVKPFGDRELFTSIQTALTIQDLHTRLEESERQY